MDVGLSCTGLLHRMNMLLSHHLDLLYRFDRGLVLKEVIRDTVHPGDRVLDAGCGTGLLSLFAAQSGAKEVIALDKTDLSAARALAKENEFSNIVFVEDDLMDVTPQKYGRFDVLIGMIYFNDPRRDEAQSKLAVRLGQNLLTPSGRRIPDRVEYVAYPLEWPSQDIATKLSDLREKAANISGRYALKLESLLEASIASPHPAWFPRRLPTGSLQRPDARVLGEPAIFASIDYAKGDVAYPPHVSFDITQPGVLNCVLFVQNLYAGNRLIFANESVSWIERSRACDAGVSVNVEASELWRHSNRMQIQPGKSSM